MPIIKSAKKRVRVSEKAAIRNSKTKRSLRTAIKAFHTALTGGDKDSVAKHSDAQSNLDKAVKKGIIHKNKAARQKSQLAARAKAAAAAPVKKAAPKAAAKKAPATKAKATKPATKKAVTKKTTKK
jgi:small subunit ribosomal protein S20